MRPSIAIEGKHELIVDIVKQYGYKNPRIFGSVSRAEDTELSDLDIVVERDSDRCSLLRLGELSYALSEALGVDIDVKTDKMLPEKSRDKIIDESMSL